MYIHQGYFVYCNYNFIFPFLIQVFFPRRSCSLILETNINSYLSDTIHELKMHLLPCRTVTFPRFSTGSAPSTHLSLPLLTKP